MEMVVPKLLIMWSHPSVKPTQGVRSTGEKDTMLFLGAKWARKSKSELEVTLSSKCLVEKLWLLLCFVGKKLTPSFFKIFSTGLIVLHTFQKKSSAFGPLPPISLYGNSRTTCGKNFGVAFFVLLAISMPKNNIHCWKGTILQHAESVQNVIHPHKSQHISE